MKGKKEKISKALIERGKDLKKKITSERKIKKKKNYIQRKKMSWE